ncbi:Aerobic glycerol-3-phosphate dehydrogenase [Thalassocella blandensis]|nr:Aerobic glycerol-3-phosphate dehydrogenase [Thalassocella blandensis]
MSNLRQHHIAQLKQREFDVLVIGGGINGAVAAAALAGKGANVALIDQGDFACETSSNSSNLAWGGIKYLENYEFLLVNKLCLSRNNLMRRYPSTVKEIRFLTTIQSGFRLPALFVYCGTLLYWLIGRCKTRIPLYFSAKKIKQREAAINIRNAEAGFEYSDCFLFDNDARFVFNFIRAGMDSGCISANYVSAKMAKREQGQWVVQAQDVVENTSFNIRAKVLVNACGPHVDQLNKILNIHTEVHHVFSKGVHLVVDKIGHNDKVLTFFASDGRLFFVIPMGQKTCIGTTDTRTDDPYAEVTEEDRQFILDNANTALDLSRPLTRADIISERCGVRPLAVKGNSNEEAWLQLSRKHIIETDAEQKCISIFGGKLTDCVNVGEEVCDAIQQLGLALTQDNADWYGEPDITEKHKFLKFAKEKKLDDLTPQYSSEDLSQRLWRRYGLQAFDIAADILQDSDAAKQLIENTEYLRAELKYTAEREMVTKLEDFVRRRSKIAMVLRTEDIVNAQGIQEACDILFGDEAQNKLAEFIDQTHP